MKSLFLALGLLATLTFPSPGSAAQAAEETAGEAASPWVVDDAGFRQWKQPGEECAVCNASGETGCVRCKGGSKAQCAECNKDHNATCRACGGDRKTYDPLEEMICPFCDGSALWTCGNCAGAGTYRTTGGARSGQKCGPCKGSGSLKCEACKGKRSMNVVKIGPDLADAKDHQLQSAREKLTGCLRQLKGFKPEGHDSNDRKALDSMIKDARGTLPDLKNAAKLFDAGVKSLRGAAQYVGYERWVAEEFVRFRDQTIKYMEHQVALIDLCLERLAYNDKVRAGE